MPQSKTEDNCHCDECKMIHEEFIEQFGRWPNVTHEDGQELKARRESNLRSWELALGDMTEEEIARIEDQAPHHMKRLLGEQQ